MEGVIVTSFVLWGHHIHFEWNIGFECDLCFKQYCDVWCMWSKMNLWIVKLVLVILKFTWSDFFWWSNVNVWWIQCRGRHLFFTGDYEGKFKGSFALEKFMFEMMVMFDCMKWFDMILICDNDICHVWCSNFIPAEMLWINEMLCVIYLYKIYWLKL